MASWSERYAEVAARTPLDFHWDSLEENAYDLGFRIDADDDGEAFCQEVLSQAAMEGVI